MNVSGQIRNAQVEHIFSKPPTAGCAGQLYYQVDGVNRNLWVSDGTRWHMMGPKPYFVFGHEDPLNDTTATFLPFDEPISAVTYENEFTVSGGEANGSPIDGYIAPCDGFINIAGSIVEERDDGSFQFARRGELQLIYYINGVPASTLYSNRSDAIIEDADWEGGESNEERFTVTARGILEVRAGDLVQLFLRKFQNGNGGSKYFGSSLEGHYIEAFHEV